MKNIINTFLPYYKHNNNLTLNVTLKNKVRFLFFYLDRFVYSPILQILLRNQNVKEQNVIKKIYKQKILNNLPLQFKKDKYDEKHHVKNQKYINKNSFECKEKMNDKIRNIKNDKINYNDHIEINALWPERISYVQPFEVKKNLEKDKFNVIYIGHMSILIQTSKYNILIDPVLSNRIGFCNILGVKRIIKPGISFEHLPSIDFILLSNNRYDTMDKRTLKNIILRDNSIVIGGMNIRRYLLKRNFPVVYPLNWFNKLSFENLSFYYLPTLTNSHRFLVDKNVYLPGSFLIHDSFTNATIFYSGHSGYSNHFLQIKNYVNNVVLKRNNHIDLSILPIGIYKPHSLYNNFHMSPSEALQSHFDLGSKQSLAIGTDVFCLGGEEYKEATKELTHILDSYQKKNNNKITFVTLQPGENFII
ncbi:conserved protein, unknown function [Plasmodium reichenowi]|uniref:Metallo-beta-lactamase domain-containing protein n=1 Tax=Plasmodium reichenowi TaxID=5854 RepID=A0A060RZ56_PLARE|nr:conserved protein, unknown function [Plasmodium reichenowi]